TAMALWSFIDCSFAQDAVAVPFTATESDDIDEDGDKDNKSRRRSQKNAGRLDTGNSALANGNENLSLGITNIADTAEVEAVVVRGSFDIYPVEYPALPPVEGTRINAGKKTSFVKPEEFPTFAGNDYREVMATTPGIIVSEEPSSPIINFGYRGLNSQRSEFMQVLKDGVSIKNEQFGFPETHYTPILDAVERIELIRAGAALQFGPQRGSQFRHENAAVRRPVSFHNQECVWQLRILPKLHRGGRHTWSAGLLFLLRSPRTGRIS